MFSGGHNGRPFNMPLPALLLASAGPFKPGFIVSLLGAQLVVVHLAGQRFVSPHSASSLVT